ncbi:MAG: CRTAC1 family protein [Bryobacteraceae bacterium]
MVYRSFTNGARLPAFDKTEPRFHNRLFRNVGEGKFVDVTESAGVRGTGYALGVAAGDFDNDGAPDLYVTGVRQNQLLRNNRDGTFVDITKRSGDLAKLGDRFRVSAGWFDYNRDGWLDLFIVQYIEWSLTTEPACTVRTVRAYCSPEKFPGLPNILMKNNGNGTFTDVSMESGIARHIGKGMGVAFGDYDGDGYMDAFVANDTFRNFLFHNRKDGTFDEVGIETGVAYNEHGKAIAGMGVDFRDVDDDGRPDIFLTGMFGDTFPLYRNEGSGSFSDVTGPRGIARHTVRLTGWGTGIYDFDNDGAKDIFTANAAILDNSDEIDRLPYRQKNLVLRRTEGGSYAPIPFGEAAAHRGAAFGDLNNDGRVDAVVSILNAPAVVLWNRSGSANHWIAFKLRGTRSNADAIGSKVKLTTADGVTHHNQVTTSVGYASSSDPRVHFGLGKASRISRVEITWPSGTLQLLKNVKVDQILNVREPE